MDLISVVIPTLNRPAALRRAIESITRQELPDGTDLDIVVVDNSADGNSRAAVEAIVPVAGRAITWINEPRPGVASARNAGVRAARGRWVAFLDDDEEASETWIAALLAVTRSSAADAVFGPVDAKADGDPAEGGDQAALTPYFARHLDRPNGADITDLVAYLGTNNSMFLKERCLEGDGPFDTTLDKTGGEDSLLLKRLTLDGRRLAWAKDARVIEWVPPRRLTWTYVRRRKLLSGQIRVLVLHRLRPVPWGEIALWMTVGVCQIGIAGAGTIALRHVARAASERASVTLYAGLGKVLWMPRFRPHLYGTGLVS